MRMGNSTEESVSVAHKQKTCSQCKKTMSVTEFSKRKKSPDGLAPRCKVCKAKYNKLRSFSVDPNLKEKKCIDCGQTKSVDEFTIKKRSLDGLNYICKVCDKKYKQSLNFSVDPNLKEKTCGKCKEAKPVAEFTKNKRRSDGLDHRCKVCKAKYQKENRVKANKRQKQRYDTDILYKLSHIIRSQNNKIINETKLEKTKQSFEYLGCTTVEFKKHIESKFVEGMTWENHGRLSDDNTECWHIDHIIPISYFVEHSDNPFMVSNYRNQRPMWAKENMSKGDTLDMELVKEYGIEDLLPTKMTWQEN